MDAKAVHSIPEFCEIHDLSRSYYYELRKKGLGPDEIHLGRKRGITVEAGARWRERMEKMTAEASAVA